MLAARISAGSGVAHRGGRTITNRRPVRRRRRCRGPPSAIPSRTLVTRDSGVKVRPARGHAVAASTFKARYSPGPSHTTLVDATDIGDVPGSGVAGRRP